MVSRSSDREDTINHQLRLDVIDRAVARRPEPVRSHIAYHRDWLRFVVDGDQHHVFGLTSLNVAGNGGTGRCRFKMPRSQQCSTKPRTSWRSKATTRFRTRAYHRAARVIERLAQEHRQLSPGREDLSELPGIGKDLAGKVGAIRQFRKI